MFFIIAFFLAALGLLLYLDTRKPPHFPPGPRWWPVVGSALRVATLQKRTDHFLLATAELAKEYGPVLGLKVGQETIVVVHGTRANREFLASDDLAGRPLGDFFNLRTWGKRRGLLLVDEKFWQDQRRFFLKQLREFGFGTKSMSILVEEEAQELVRHIFETMHHNDTAIFNIPTLFNVHILNSLWRMLAGVRYGAGDNRMRELQGILNELFRSISMVGTTFSHFPILRYLAPDRSGFELYTRSHKRIWDFLRKEIERHKKTRQPDAPRDVMDVYLNVLDSSKSVPDSFSEDQLLATCMDMFMAGSETTSNTLSFCFLYLILNPAVQTKAQEEVDAVVGKDRMPSLEDRPNLPYVECVVMESLRMFGGRAFTVPHRALKDTNLLGYCIPKDVLVIGNLYGSMLEEGCGFDEPEQFKPERFLIDGKISLPDSFLPFGFGRHRCLGESLARANIFLFVAAMLQKFNFSIDPGNPPTTEWSDGVTPGPKPFRACVKPRA